MAEAESDSTPQHRFETEFFQDLTRHTGYVEKEKIGTGRSNCEELGRGVSVLFTLGYRKLRAATAQ